MRKFTALFGSCLFFFIIMCMYMILDQFNSTLDSKDKFIKEAMKAAKSVEEIRSRMEKLEAGLGFSDKMIHTMNEKVSDLLNAEQVDKSDGAVQPIHIPNQIIIDSQNVSSEMCSFTGSLSGHKQDIRMLDVFDKLPFDNIDGGVWKQGWDVKYAKNAFDKNKLLVFVVPHSHNDPGWLKTVERYFHDQTNHIISNIVDALVRDPNRKFIWAETSYFQMWWDSTSFQSKQMAQQIIKNGQLEIVTGGWVMNDEANPHYFNMLDQLIEGHQWLERHIGVKPTYGWAIDPFGYSSTMAYLLKRMHFDGMLIQRVHYNVKKHLALKKQLEFMWRQNWDHSDSTDIFTHLMPFYSYDIPHTCGPDPKVCCQFDFARLPGGGKFCPWHIPPRPVTDSNVKERAGVLLDQYRKKAQLYHSNVVLAPLGDDFRWDKAFEVNAQFSNYDKIIDYVNTHPELKAEIKYGTLKDYFHAVAEREGVKPGEKPPTFPSLGGDFFTYADRDDHYWSGYYTSRAFFKHMDREVASYLRGAEILFSLAIAHSRYHSNFPQQFYPKLLLGRKQLALFQHHDGITGTAKDHVVADYGMRLHDTIRSSMKIMQTSADYLLTEDKSKYEERNPEMNLLTFDDTYDNFDSVKGKKVVVISDDPSYVVLYNTLAQQRRQTVSFHISEPLVEVYDYTEQLIPHQVSLLWKSSTEAVTSKYELTFVGVIPPLGLAKYKIKRAHSDGKGGVASTKIFNAVLQEKVDDRFSVKKSVENAITVENKYLKAIFDTSSGLLTDLSSDKKMRKVQIHFMTYGTVSKMDRSGAYLFLPSGQASSIQAKNTPVTVTEGKIYTEVLTRLQYVIHRIRIYHSDNDEAKSLDIQNTLDIRHSRNLELVMRIESDIKNLDKEFFTDLNGFQMQRRKTLKKLPLQANFYPVPAMAYIEDEESRLSLLTQQSNGVASLETGYLEVVLDRRLMQDDNRGLGQGVTDNKITPSNFKLLLENFNKATKVKKIVPIPIGYPSLSGISLMHQLQHPVFTLIVSTGMYLDKFVPLVSGLKKSLPCDLHLVNFKTLEDNIKELPSETGAFFLHRIGYDCRFPKKCHDEKVTFADIFSPLTVHELESTSLSLMHSKKYLNSNTIINIPPMEIEAFKMKLR